MKDDGGPAFPAHIAEIQGVATHSGEFALGGLSLRDYFAAAALQAPWAQAVSQHEPAATASDCADLAANCYALADALLKAREQ